MSLVRRLLETERIFKERSGFVIDSPDIWSDKQPDGRVQLHAKAKKKKAPAAPSAFAGYFQAAENFNGLYVNTGSGFTLFATIAGPIGVAASGSLLLVTQYSSQNVLSVAPGGSTSVFATIPAGVLESAERYIAIVPPESGSVGFTPGDVFVTQGKDIYRIHAGIVSLFATISAANDDHTGITFDRVGTFENKMILTANNGKVWKVDHLGSAMLVADLSTSIEGPAVVASSFGIYGGQIWVADENAGAIHAVKNDGTITTDIIDWSGAEACIWLPDSALGLGPAVIVPSELGGGVALITWSGSEYDTAYFGDVPGGGLFEGGAYTAF